MEEINRIEIKVEECAGCEDGTGEIVRVIVMKNGAGGEYLIPVEKVIVHMGKIWKAVGNRKDGIIKLPETLPLWPLNGIAEIGGYEAKETSNGFFISTNAFTGRKRTEIIVFPREPKSHFEISKKRYGIF